MEGNGLSVDLGLLEKEPLTVPIRPENKALYPNDWKAISHRIRFERAKGRCEFDWPFGSGERCGAHHGEEHPDTGSRVVLTVAHLDHDPTNNRDENLKAGCQRCHNAYDAPMRRAGMRKRAKAKMASGDLLERGAAEC